MTNYKFVIFSAILSLLLSTINTYNLTSNIPYTITQTRSSQMIEQCRTTNRNSLNQKYSNAESIEYSSEFTTLFTLNNTFFTQFMAFNIADMNSTLTQNQLGYILFIVLPLISLAIILIAAPIMYILLFCPFQCCLRKKLIYNQCEQTWPTIIYIILGFTIISFCGIGVFSQYKINNGYQEYSCAATVIFDDALNGNINPGNSSFFSGIATINQQLTLFNKQSNSIYSNLAQLSSKSTAIPNSLNLISEGLNYILQIPNLNGTTLDLKYQSPLRSSTPTQTISSKFPALLGTYNDSSSLVGQTYLTLQIVNNTISSLQQQVDTFSIRQKQFLNHTSQLNTQTNQISQDLATNLITINDILKSNTFPYQYSFIQVLIYGLIFGQVFLMLITIFCIFNKKISCRHPNYFLGFLLFITTIGTLILSLVLGFAVPISHSGCNYLTSTISNPIQFQKLLSKLGMASTNSQSISLCLLGQNSNIITSLNKNNTTYSFAQLTTLMKTLTSLNTPTLVSNLKSTFTSLQKNIYQYSTAETLDISNPEAINDLTYISNPINFNNCIKGNFQKDSWIPNSNQTDNTIPCRSPSISPNVDNSTCPNTISFTSTVNCSGCMSTFSLLYNLNTSSSVYSYLNTRYTDCSQFNTDLSNVWINYYLIKKNILSSVLERKDTAQISMDKISSNLTEVVSPLVTKVVNNLYNTSSSFLDPQKGIINGLNCKIVGQDILLFKNCLCHNTFSYFFFHKIIISSISILLCFFLCCNTCILFRKKKDIENGINYPQDSSKRVKAQVIRQSGNRLHNIQL